MNHYELDPAWYLRGPGLAYDAALKITKVQLELSCDSDMLIMFESGIRIATISHRHAKAKYWYKGDEIDSTKESKFISYLHTSNLCGWAMAKQLPTSGFAWMTDDDLDDWKHLSCILEVDLEYPEHLHDHHNNYPLALQRVKIRDVEKLIPNLNNKTNYVVHYANWNYTKA